LTKACHLKFGLPIVILVSGCLQAARVRAATLLPTCQRGWAACPPTRPREPGPQPTMRGELSERRRQRGQGAVRASRPADLPKNPSPFWILFLGASADSLTPRLLALQRGAPSLAQRCHSAAPSMPLAVKWSIPRLPRATRCSAYCHICLVAFCDGPSLISI
jgi:hypothetical protein